MSERTAAYERGLAALREIREHMKTVVPPIGGMDTAERYVAWLDAEASTILERHLLEAQEAVLQNKREFMAVSKLYYKKLIAGATRQLLDDLQATALALQDSSSVASSVAFAPILGVLIANAAADIDFAIDVTEPRSTRLGRFSDVLRDFAYQVRVQANQDRQQAIEIANAAERRAQQERQRNASLVGQVAKLKADIKERRTPSERWKDRHDRVAAQLSALQASVREKLEAAWERGDTSNRPHNAGAVEVRDAFIDRLLAAPEPPQEGKL